MEKIDFKTFKEKLSELDFTLGSFIDEQLSDEDFKIFSENFGDVRELDSIGGYEGGGERQMKVLHFTDLDLYVKVEGYYDSWGGASWDSFFEVEPYEEVVIKFKKV